MAQLKPWEGFSGLRTYPETLQRDLRGLDAFLKELRTKVAQLLIEEPLSTTSTAAVPQSRLLTAGAGLTGGGDLSADRSFDIGAGTGILVGADAVSLAPVSPTSAGSYTYASVTVDAFGRVTVASSGTAPATLSSATPTTVDLTGTGGVAATASRSDHEHALDQTIAPTWTAVHTFSSQDIHNAGVDLGTSGRINSNVANSTNNVTVLVKPTTALTASTDARAMFGVHDSAGGVNMMCYPSGTTEFGGVSAYATSAVIAVLASTGKAIGFNFSPNGMTSTGTSAAGASSIAIGGFFHPSPAASATPAATGGYAAGVFDGPDYTSVSGGSPSYGVIVRGRGVSTGNNGITFPTTYGIKINSMLGGKNAGIHTDVYQAYIANAFASAAATGFTIANTYGLYIEAQTRGSTLNNGIFINCDATATQRAIAIRSQNEFIHSGAAGNLTMGAGTNFVMNIGGADQVSIQANLWQINVNQFDFQLPTATGTKFGTTNTEKLSFWGVTPIVQPSAFTQTYSTASKTHSNPTATTIATTAATNTTPYGYTTQAQADAIVTAINALIVDVANVKQVLNAVIDDGQAEGLLA